MRFFLLLAFSLSAFAEMVDINNGGGIGAVGGAIDAHAVTASGNGGTVITAGATNMDFTEVSDPSGAWNGTQYTAPEGGLYLFIGVVNKTGSGLTKAQGFIGGVVLRSGSALHNTDLYSFVFLVRLTTGQVFSIRDSAGGTLENDADHNLNIARVSE